MPGIGEKTALRLALFILREPSQYSHDLANALLEMSQKIGFCQTCFHLTDSNPCSLCADTRRDSHVLCVVEDSSDLMALERTRGFKGLYHVLHGCLSPLDGIGPEQLRIRELINRIRQSAVSEVILATNPNVTGDATALYISKQIKSLGVKLTRLASGIPVGSDIEYADTVTLARALQLRVEY